MTGADLLARGIRALAAAGVPDAAGDARRLLCHALGLPRARLTPALRDPVTARTESAFDALIARRCRFEPVSHLTGRRAFWGRDFEVTRAVLDPRPETETLVAAALEEPFARLLDLGTGSGCLLLTLLAERPGATGLGTDLSAAALEVAARNRAALDLAARADLARGDWFGAVPYGAGPFDLIVSNPPYIAADEMAGLAPDVRLWEPDLALSDGGDGLGAYRVILRDAARHLAPGGRLLLEIGPTQAAAVGGLANGAGLVDIALRHDLDGRDRVLCARLPKGRASNLAGSDDFLDL